MTIMVSNSQNIRMKTDMPVSMYTAEISTADVMYHLVFDQSCLVLPRCIWEGNRNIASYIWEL